MAQCHQVDIGAKLLAVFDMQPLAERLLESQRESVAGLVKRAGQIDCDLAYRGGAGDEKAAVEMQRRLTRNAGLL